MKEAQALAQSRLTEIETLRQKLKESGLFSIDSKIVFLKLKTFFFFFLLNIEQNIERVKLETSKTSNGDIVNKENTKKKYLLLINIHLFVLKK